MSAKCNVDHLAFVGKFCPACGTKVEVNPVTCTNGHIMNNDAKFCAECGSKVTNRENVCSNQHTLREGAKFCNVCGEKVSNSNINEYRSKPVSNSSTVRREIRPTPLINQTPIIRTTESFLQRSDLENNLPLQDFNANSKNHSNKNFIFAGLAGLLVLILGVVFVGTVNSGSSPVTVTVEMVLIDEYDCFDISWGYSDIPGGQVVLDVDGVEYFGTYNSFGTPTGSGCKFTASISNVDSNGVNYSVGMASGRRGTIYNSREDLRTNDWTFYLSLG